MIIVIDGYNVLKQMLVNGYVSEHQKKQFINQLSVYGKRKGHKIVLVFDGGPYEWPDKDRINNVYVIHSGVNESADEYIKRYLTEHKVEDLLLVSTDRDLCKHAWRMKIESIDATDFYKLLQYDTNAKTKYEIETQKNNARELVKLTKNDHPELDIIMKEATKIVPRKSEDKLVVKHERKSPSRTPSKKERRMLKKIKKL